MRSEEFWKWFDGYAAPRLENTMHAAKRYVTFRKMFEHLDRFDRDVVIVETGSLEELDNWSGNGCSSIQFDKYVATHPGSAFVSIDIRRVHTELTQNVFTSSGSRAITGDSVEVLKSMVRKGTSPPIDLLYLDGSHLDWNNETPAANHHLNELYAVMPLLRPESLVVVDDSPAMIDDFPRLVVGGKGAFVAKHAFAVGAELVFHEYQIGWTRMTNRPVPSTTDLRELMGRAREHADANRLVQADEIYRLVLVLCGPHPMGNLERRSRAEASAFFGMNAREKGKHATSVDWFRDAVTVDAGWVDHRLALVRANHKVGLWEAARAEAERATRIAPDDYRTWKALGDMEDELGNAEGVIAAFDKALELAPPDHLDGYLDRCGIAVDVEDYELAKKLSDKLMGTKIENDAWHVRGMIHYRHGEHEKAIECFDKAIAMKARDPAQVHWNRSLPLHAIGRYREGWKEHEWRVYATHQPALSMPFRRFQPLPVWNGQPPPALIHVHGEAGAGDNIACARYMRLLTERGYEVRYECLGTMEKMFADSFPDVEVIERAKDFPGILGIEPFDYHCPIGSLPAIFETDIDTVPTAMIPYIKADPELVASYAAKMTGTRNWPQIGLCWSSGIRLKEGIWMEKYGRHKSMNFESLVPLVKARQIDSCFYNLQVGPERAEQYGILDVLPEKPSWAETAALVANLDLVITVDTGLAHLAGAMGKPVWVMMHTQGSWHFMVERPGFKWNERSPWYPSARIFRQKVPGDWVSVVARVAASLAEEKLEAAE
jgi:tetratricopeptide (TPR) repeat protein